MSYGAAVGYWASFVLGGWSGAFFAYGMAWPAILMALIALGLFAIVTRRAECY